MEAFKALKDYYIDILMLRYSITILIIYLDTSTFTISSILF